MQRSDFILAVGRVGRRKLARLDVSHPYQRAFLNHGLVRTRVIDEEADPTLDQATMYAAGLSAMVMQEMADVADTLENRVFRNMDMQDVRMNEVERCQEPAFTDDFKILFSAQLPTFPHSSLFSHDLSSSKQDKTIHW